jgi:hypothetical protein
MYRFPNLFLPPRGDICASMDSCFIKAGSPPPTFQFNTEYDLQWRGPHQVTQGNGYLRLQMAYGILYAGSSRRCARTRRSLWNTNRVIVVPEGGTTLRQSVLPSADITKKCVPACQMTEKGAQISEHFYAVHILCYKAEGRGFDAR